MKILTLNCNGIRSAISKGLLTMISSENPDIIAFQETKAPENEIRKEHWKEMGYEIQTCIADKAGYSGVCTLVKKSPLSSISGYGDGIFKSEGRSILLEYPKFLFWNVYFPSGTSGDERQKIKYKFLDEVLTLSKKLKAKKKPLILVGDVNIAHMEIDIHNPKSNAKNSGFLPEERAWFSQFLRKGFIDFYRELNPDLQKYSWWSYRANARANDKGWRIDYVLGSDSLLSVGKKAKIINEPIVSDHAAVVVELQMP
ncbi:MAG: exodeoxyribonuclease III [Leptospira sp.]|nr:exodeoxyribonuclease III [Leptospira sp.]